MASIRTKFLFAVVALAVVCFGLVFWRMWHSVGAHTQELTEKQAALALKFDMAIRRYVGNRIRPIVEQHAGQDEFIPETMSTSFVARSIFEDVRRDFPDYLIKFSSDDPRNPANMAEPEEREIIEYFRANPQAAEWIGPAILGGKSYLLHAIPRRMEEACLRCHGDPKDAPASLLARYGETAGFHRKLGDVMALDTVGIPTDSTQAAMNRELRTQLLLLGLGVVVVTMALVWCFRVLVSDRLGLIAAHFRRAAMQREGEPLLPIEVEGSDEISVLARSFNALAARLGDLHDTLDQRVAQRTAMLEAEVQQRMRLEEASRLAQFCIDQAADAIFWLDAEGRVVYANRSACQRLGYSTEELCAMSVHDIDPHVTAAFWKSHWADLQRRKSFVIESAHRTRDGELIPMEVAANHIEFGGREYNCALARDITERKKSDALLQKAKEMADVANRAKSEFLANMSHEIRTPMTAILGYVDVLSEGCARKCPLTHTGHYDPIDVIRRNAQHLLSLIDDVLDLSKIEAGQLTIERAVCSPCEVISEVASLMRVRTAAKRLSLDVEYDGPIPESIHTDPTRLRQIIINIVGNAIKFTDQGHVRLIARLDRADPAQPMLEIRVVDTGIGMSPETIEKLFRPFTQADASTSRRFGGSGLGLTISRRLAEALGGSLDAAGLPLQGSTFTLRVATGPLEGVRLIENPTESECRVADNSPKRATDTALPPGCRLLLAEDGPDNQRLLTLLLNKAGAEVVVVENGRDAVERAMSERDAGRPFDVVLMDIQMPEMDGYEATRRLRAAGYANPIVALTAHAMRDDRQCCLDAGCTDYLSKPINRRQLIETIARHIAKTVEAGQLSSR